MRKLALLPFVLLGPGGAADAALAINIYELGPDVVFTVTGGVKLDALKDFLGEPTAFDGFIPTDGAFASGGAPTRLYSVTLGLPRWAPFGPGAYDSWTTSGGDTIALFNGPSLGLPLGYATESALSASGTKTAASLASLGMTSGTYVNTLTNGLVSDTITVTVGAVPEPSTALLSVVAIPALLRRRRTKR